MVLSNKLFVNVSSGTGGGGGGGIGTPLPAKFQIASSWNIKMPVSMIHYTTGQPLSPINLWVDCYYVSDYFPNNPCCGSKPSGYAFRIYGSIVDTVGNPVPNQSYLIYLLNSDPNMKIIDYVTGKVAVNPSSGNPLNAMSDSNGNMNLGIVYYGYPSPDKNSNNYPSAPFGGGCSTGNIIPEFAVTDNIALQIPNTAVQGQTVVSISWEKHYVTKSNPEAISCPNQTNNCFW
jgi:hypothetical protein